MYFLSHGLDMVFAWNNFVSLPEEIRNRYLSINDIGVSQSHDLCDLIYSGLQRTVARSVLGLNTQTTIWDSDTGEKVLDINPGTTYKDLEPYVGELSDDEKNEIKALLMELKLTK